MSEDRFIQLVTRKLAGDISPADAEELNRWLEQSEYLQRFERLKRFWSSREIVPDVEKALGNVMQSIENEKDSDTNDEVYVKRSRNFRRAWLAVPAILLIPIAIYVFRLNNATTSKATSTKSLVAANASGVIEKQNLKGTRSLITLADGSNVWLNADSKLKYPAVFNGDTREVELEGEAFFEIAKNKQKPFIIHLDNGTVRVLGTSFNVKAYKGESFVETAVVTGKVAFIPKSEKKQDTTFLTPDLKAIYTIETGVVKTIPTIGVEDKAWTEGKFIFRNETMADIAAVLERSFGKEFVFNSEDIKAYRMTGSFENNSLEDILFYLARLKPFTYRISESQVLLFGM